MQQHQTYHKGLLEICQVHGKWFDPRGTETAGNMGDHVAQSLESATFVARQLIRFLVAIVALEVVVYRLSKVAVGVL